MAISVSGLVSGLDSASIVSKLVELEQRPVQLLQDKKTKNSEQLTAWQEVNTRLKAFETAALKLNTASSFLGTKGTFTNDVANGPNIVSIATTSTAASSGTFSFTVGSLASQHKVVSTQGYASASDNILHGGVTITKGSQTQTFTQTTLDGLKTAINNAGLGVTASVIDTTGVAGSRAYKLQIASNTAGSANAFTISAAPGEGPVGPTGMTIDFATAAQGTDASITLDGVTATRSTNTFNDILPGVSLTVSQEGSGIIALASDTDTVLANINDLVKTYNDVIDYSVQQTTYDKNSDTQKPLFGNTTLLNIQQTIRGVVSGAVAGIANTQNQWSTLSQVGIKTDVGNKLSVDAAVLTQALRSNTTGVKNLFTSGGSGTFTFVGARGSTTAGLYETLATGGTIKMRLQGTNNDWITLTGSGNFFDAPAGSTLEGLTIRADASTLWDNTAGQMTVWVGAAEQATYKAKYFTEYASTGPIFNARKSLEQRNLDHTEEIDAMNMRIKKKQDDLTAKFARLETTLSKLKGQGDYLSQQLNYMPSTMATKKK